MRLALQEAQRAADMGEVPVGAVLVQDGQLLARNHNRTRQLGDPTAHAEMLVLRDAAARLGQHRLGGCTLYITLEPCAMCSGAIFQARLARIVYAASEPKTGAAGSVIDLFAMPQLNHHTQVERGLLAEAASAQLAQFFQHRRQQQHQQRRQAPTLRLREDALRTPEACFAHSPAAGHYFASSDGWRVHYQQTRPASPPSPPSPPSPAPPAAAAPTFLLLHPLWHWSAWWQPLLLALAQQGCHALAPDLPGWGRSDKPKKTDWHTLPQHARILAELLADSLAAPSAADGAPNSASNSASHNASNTHPIILITERSALPLAHHLAHHLSHTPTQTESPAPTARAPQPVSLHPAITAIAVLAPVHDPSASGPAALGNGRQDATVDTSCRHSPSHDEAWPHRAKIAGKRLDSPALPPWPANPALANHKRWSLRQHWQTWCTQHAPAPAALELACAPYPDAGHARAWFAQALAPASANPAAHSHFADNPPTLHALPIATRPPEPLTTADAQALASALQQLHSP